MKDNASRPADDGTADRNSDRFPHLLDAPILRDLSIQAKCALLDRCGVRTFDAPTAILTQGAPVDGMHLIANGGVEVICHNPDGHSVLIHFARSQEILGEVEALSNNASAATCTAQPNTTVLFCPLAVLQEQAGSPVFLRNLTGVFYDRMDRDNKAKFIDQFYPVERRLCAYLYRLSVGGTEISKTQSELAGYLGCARQTLNRELGLLRDRNIIILAKGRIRVIDMPALLARATTKPTTRNDPAPDKV